MKTTEPTSKKGIMEFMSATWEGIQNSITEMKLIESQVDELGLSKDRISRQSLEELEKTLRQIDEWIEKRRIPNQKDDQDFTKISSTLLSRKEVIRNRIAYLRGRERIKNLEELAAKVADGETRERFEEEIADLKNQVEQSREESRILQEERENLQDKILYEERVLNNYERRAKVWHSFIEREYIATVVGAFLLVSLTFIMIIANFENIKINEVLSNAFLILLGYFFGQTTAIKSEEKRH